MSTTTQPVRPLVRGFDWSLQIAITNASAPAFPSGVALKATITHNRLPTLALTLTTGAGTLARISDTTMQLTIAGTVSAAWPPGTISLDVVRTDGASPQYLGFTLSVPVTESITSAT